MRFGNCKSVTDLEAAIRDHMESASRPGKVEIAVCTDDPFVWEGVDGIRPGPSFDARWQVDDLVATDGEVKVRVKERNYSYPTTDETRYQGRISDWSFIVLTSSDYRDWEPGSDYQDFRVILKDAAEAERLKAVVAGYDLVESVPEVLVSVDLKHPYLDAFREELSHLKDEYIYEFDPASIDAYPLVGISLAAIENKLGRKLTDSELLGLLEVIDKVYREFVYCLKIDEVEEVE